VPVSYLLTEADTVISPERQLKSVERIEREAGRKVDVYKANVAHAAYVLNPEAVAKVIIEVANKNG
jgi:hypothetical protein